MKLIPNEIKLNRIIHKSWKRWSILASFLIYVLFVFLTRYLEIPLKSGDEVKESRSPRFVVDNNIINYLHRLHNLKSNLEITEDYDGEKIQPFYALEEIFHKADSDHDNFLTVQEVSRWINTQTQQHIHQAIADNYKIFTEIDVKPKNGLISWTEYHSYFLLKNGYNKTYAEVHDEKHKELSRHVKEAIMRDKADWTECAKLDPDHLTLDEFLSFKHPESSFSTIISLVDEIYRKFDRDGDDLLTEDEFSSLQTDEDYEKPESVREEERKRREEFRDMVDGDGDGKVTRREMMTYIDPKNPRHAKEEAETLFDLSDVDGDGRLSLVEIFNKVDLFLGSKMVDTARSFHDEF